MPEHHMVDIPIGFEIRSSYRAPIDGVYAVAQHVESSKCKPLAKEGKLYKMRGQLMPMCPKCGKRVIWKLAEYKVDVPPELDNTEFAMTQMRGDHPFSKSGPRNKRIE